MSQPAPFPAFRDLRPERLMQLLGAAAELGPCRTLETLGPTLFRVLRGTLPIERLALWLGAPEDGMAVTEWGAEATEDGALRPSPPPPGWVAFTRDLPTDVWGLDPAAGEMREPGWPCWALLPLRSQERVVGGLVVASREPEAFEAAGPIVLEFLARFLASFALRILRLRQLDELNAQLTRERDQQRVLLQITNELMEHREPRDLFQAIARSLRERIAFDGLALVLVQPDTQEAQLRFLDFPSARGHMHENLLFTVTGGPTHQALETRLPVVFDEAGLRGFPAPIPQKLVEGEGILSLCCIPLVSRSRVMGALNFSSRRAGAFPEDLVVLLARAAAQVAIALDNAFAYEEIQSLRDQLAEENQYLQEEMDKDAGLEIIGGSPSLLKVLEQARTVAPSGATVLLLGETGTGKELLARTIHQLSPRAGRAFVQVNCAAIPAGLVESELFGHEKGAFTGALATRMGRLELAHRGTLFLDEIGDLPLDLQPKLLRALQEREIERLGSNASRKVDLRLVAATNRDLAAMVEAREFRADLYYRLNVFPIRIPPLRERREDIPTLVRYFTQKFARRMHKQVETVPEPAMRALAAWDWPGNIRELENFIERSVILTRGRDLQVPLAELEGARQPGPGPAPTLEDAERSAIREALEACRGKVGGADGAAARLGLKRTTLQSRMKKLGVDLPK